LRRLAETYNLPELKQEMQDKISEFQVPERGHLTFAMVVVRVPRVLMLAFPALTWKLPATGK
jgi:hypothetical protein